MTATGIRLKQQIVLHVNKFMPPGSLQARFAGGTLWTTGGCAFSQIMSVVSGVILARLLGLYGFGQFGIIYATVLSLVTFGDLGLSLSTTKHVASAKAADPGSVPGLIRTSTLLVLCSSLALGAILIVGSTRMASRWFGGSVQSAALAVAAVLLGFELLNRLQLGCLSGLQAFRSSALVQIARGFALVILPALFALRFGLTGALIGMALVSMCTCVLSHLCLVRECRPLRQMAPHSGGDGVRSLLSMAGAVWVSGVMLAGSTYAAKLALAGAHGGMNEMGLLNAAEKWRVAVEFLASMLAQVSIPIMAAAFTAGMYDRLRKLLLGAHAVAFVTSALAAVVLSLAGGLIMRAYGPEFLRGRNVLSICALVAVITAAYSVGSAALWAIGKVRVMLTLDAIKAAVLIGCVQAGLVTTATSYAWVSLASVALGLAGMTVLLRFELKSMKSHQPGAYAHS